MFGFRDIYHSLFGLAGLLQTAEMAWQQGDASLYASGGHLLAAALELHASIVRAGSNSSSLPQGFAQFSDMPPPPAGCIWRMDMRAQRWAAVNASTGAFVSHLTNGVKYILGSKFIPGAFELGYVHYARRLGLPMPETAALLAANPLEHYELAWGLNGLTHAGSAELLWVPGLTADALCGGGSGSSNNDGSKLPVPPNKRRLVLPGPPQPAPGGIVHARSALRPHG